MAHLSGQALSMSRFYDQLSRLVQLSDSVTDWRRADGQRGDGMHLRSAALKQIAVFLCLTLLYTARIVCYGLRHLVVFA